MNENLRLGNNPSSTGIIAQDITLTSNDSDIPAGGNNFTIHTSDVQTTSGTNWNDSNWDVNRIYSFTNNDSVSAENKVTYGNLYNWYTATAGSGTHTGTTGGADATSSICPKGWQLPPNTGDGSYTKLMQSTSTTSSISTGTSGTNAAYVAALQAAPLSFVLSGYYNSSPVNQGVYGYYWSRTPHSSNTDYSMGLVFRASSSDFGLQSYGNKFNGFAVRCVLVPPKS